MKFAASVLIYVSLAALLACGLLQAAHGHYGLLAVGCLGYILALAKIGCLPPTGSH